MIRLSNFTFVGILQPTSTFDPTACSVALVGAFPGGSDNFECYVPAIGFSSTVTGGSGWTGGARIGTGYLWLRSSDLFETYPVGAIGTLNDGPGWSGAWVIR